MSTLHQAVRAWRETPFPRGSTVEALDEAHADLALYDTWVAETVIPFVERGIWNSAVTDVLGALDDLTRQVGDLRSAGTEDSEAADSYMAYAGLLRAVYLAFLDEASA